MDARRTKRKIVSIRAELIIGDRSWASFIENLSEEGIFVTTSAAESSAKIAPQISATLRFPLPAGKKAELSCRIIWTLKLPPYGLTQSVGMEIIDPPASYKEYLKSLP